MTDKQQQACEILCALLQARPRLTEDPLGAVDLAWKMATRLDRLGEEEEEEEDRNIYREDISED